MIYVIIQNQIVLKITDIDSVPQPSTERIRTLSGNPRNVLWNWYAESLHILPSVHQPCWSNFWALQTESHHFWHLQLLGIGSSSHCPTISSDDIRSVPGTFPENLPKFDSRYNTEYIQLFLIFWRQFLYSDTLPTLFTHAQTTATLTAFKLLLKFQMREVYT